jgi:predicted glycosyl hydrolase (DUF1957 family)
MQPKAISPVLHAHLLLVRHPEYALPRRGWFFEALTETYCRRRLEGLCAMAFPSTLRRRRR